MHLSMACTETFDCPQEAGDAPDVSLSTLFCNQDPVLRLRKMEAKTLAHCLSRLRIRLSRSGHWFCEVAYRPRVISSVVAHCDAIVLQVGCFAWAESDFMARLNKNLPESRGKNLASAALYCSERARLLVKKVTHIFRSSDCAGESGEQYELG